MPDDVLWLQKCRHASQNRLSKAISTNVLPSFLATFGVQGLSFLPSIDKLKYEYRTWKSLEVPELTPSHPTAEQEAQERHIPVGFYSVEGKFTKGPTLRRKRGSAHLLYHLIDDPSIVKGREGLSIKSLVTLKPSFVLQTPLYLLSFFLLLPVFPVVHTATAP